MNFSAVICHYKRKLQTSTFWLVGSQFIMAHQYRKSYFWHNCHAIALQHLVFMKNGGQPRRRPFFYFQILKILFISRDMAPWKWYINFQFLYKICWRKRSYGNLATIFFQKFWWCSSLSLFSSELWVTGENDPWD